MAITANLLIDQGSTFSASLSIASTGNIPFNLTGWTATSQIRRTYASSVAQIFTTQIDVPTNGIIVLGLTDEMSSVLKPGRYVYDVVIEKNGEIYRAIEGIVTVNASVTRP
jgi:hypothetical protein